MPASFLAKHHTTSAAVVCDYGIQGSKHLNVLCRDAFVVAFWEAGDAVKFCIAVQQVC